MPIKRRLTKARLDVIDLWMESHLRSGSYLIPVGGSFVDDAHRREAWLLHRDKIMAKEGPGRRPDAYWTYDRAWPDGSESEQDAVFRLEDTTAEERREIERNWRHSVRVSLMHGKTEEDARARAAGYHGVPRWFFDQHAPALSPGRLPRGPRAEEGK